MAKKQGKIKSISVKEVTEGMQVLIFEYNLIASVVHLNSRYAVVKDIRQDMDRNFVTTIKELKTLVVEYRKLIIEPEYGNEVSTTKQIPLKYSQWQSAIDNGEVDSDKIVDFEIIRSARDSKDKSFNCKSGSFPLIEGFCYAKIIPSKKKMYTEEEVEKLCRLAFDRVIVLPHDTISFKEWKKHHLK